MLGYFLSVPAMSITKHSTFVRSICLKNSNPRPLQNSKKAGEGREKEKEMRGGVGGYLSSWAPSMIPGKSASVILLIN